MKDRIKKLRKALDLTQQVFAEQIGTTQNVLANYETGRRNPSNSVINNICKTFHVSEEWLRFGKGKMFLQQSRKEEISAFIDSVMAEESASFRQRLVSTLSRLNPEQWDALESVTMALMKGDTFDTASTQGSTPVSSNTIDNSQSTSTSISDTDITARLAVLERENEKTRRESEQIRRENAELRQRLETLEQEEALQAMEELSDTG